MKLIHSESDNYSIEQTCWVGCSFLAQTDQRHMRARLVLSLNVMTIARLVTQRRRLRPADKCQVS